MTAKLVVDAVFRQFGTPATLMAASGVAGGGSPIPVRVIAKRPDTLISYGATAVVSETARFELRVSEVAAPAQGDAITVDGAAYLVQSARRLDPDRLVWTIEAAPVSPDDPALPPRSPNPGSAWDRSYQSLAAVDLAAGVAVCVTPAGLAPARADVEALTEVRGLVISDAAARTMARWVAADPIELPDWSGVVSGGGRELIPGASYYLSDQNPGQITTDQPQPGRWVVPVGYAVTATVFHVEIGFTYQA